MVTGGEPNGKKICVKKYHGKGSNVGGILAPLQLLQYITSSSTYSSNTHSGHEKK